MADNIVESVGGFCVVDMAGRESREIDAAGVCDGKANCSQ